MQQDTKELRFTTNINCSGCVAAVKPFLDKAEGILQWEVDTSHKNKILTVRSSGMQHSDVIEAVRKAGFTIEPVTL